MVTPSLVVVVDDDESVREALPDLLREFGFTVEAFSSAEEFLTSGVAGRTSCLVLDIRMPGMSGLELQAELLRRRSAVPVVFITAHGDAALRARLIAGGAVECLLKPFDEGELLEAVNAAVARV